MYSNSRSEKLKERNGEKGWNNNGREREREREYFIVINLCEVSLCSYMLRSRGLSVKELVKRCVFRIQWSER